MFLWHHCDERKKLTYETAHLLCHIRRFAHRYYSCIALRSINFSCLRLRICQRWTSLLILTMFLRWFLVWCVWRSLKPRFWKKLEFSTPQPGWVCRWKGGGASQLKNCGNHFLSNNDWLPKKWGFYITMTNFEFSISLLLSLLENLTPFSNTNYFFSPIQLSDGSWARGDAVKWSIFAQNLRAVFQLNPQLTGQELSFSIPKNSHQPIRFESFQSLGILPGPQWFLLPEKWSKNCQDYQSFNWHIFNCFPATWLLSKMLEFVGSNDDPEGRSYACHVR